MQQNDIYIEYEEIELTPEEMECRIFASLNSLINLDNDYEQETNSD